MTAPGDTESVEVAADPAARSKPRKKWRGWVWIVLGVLVLLYPIAATLWNNYRLQHQADLYSASVQRVEPKSELTRLREEAQAYNAWLNASGHHALPPDPRSPGFDRYLQTLRLPGGGDTMARVIIESINVDLPVAHTSRSEVLYRGAGHMFGSDLPIGGRGNNAVITAHTGMVDASMFDQLPALKEGAIVKIQVLDETLYYRVTHKKVVKPNEWQQISYEPDRDKITLVTCTPYGINSDRLLVEAERVDPGSADAGSLWKLPLSWWMLLDLLILLIVIFLLVRSERRRRRRKAARAEAARAAAAQSQE